MLNNNQMQEHRARKQQQLRSCLEDTESLAKQYSEKKNEKKVIEYEVN